MFRFISLLIPSNGVSETITENCQFSAMVSDFTIYQNTHIPTWSPTIRHGGCRYFPTIPLVQEFFGIFYCTDIPHLLVYSGCCVS